MANSVAVISKLCHAERSRSPLIIPWFLAFDSAQADDHPARIFEPMSNITFEEFQAVDIRVGTIVSAKEFPEAKKPAYKLSLDLGSLGIKNSSAQITDLYTADELVGRQVICVVNFKPMKIAGFTSEILVLGAETETGIVLLDSDKTSPNGSVVA